jgi:hypothetical protein
VVSSDSPGPERLGAAPASGVSIKCSDDESRVLFDGKTVVIGDRKSGAQGEMLFFGRRGHKRRDLFHAGKGPVQLPNGDWVQFDPKGCEVSDAAPGHTVQIDIDGGPGEVRVFGCGRSKRMTGEHVSLDIPPWGCTLRASRKDGAFQVGSVPIRLQEGAPIPQGLSFDFPDERMAGLGVRIASSDDGVAMEKIIDGSALSEVGLEDGDVILEIDGVSTWGLSLEDFIDIGLGPVDSRVELVVDTRDGERTVEIERRYF